MTDEDHSFQKHLELVCLTRSHKIGVRTWSRLMELLRMLDGSSVLQKENTVANFESPTHGCHDGQNHLHT